MPVLPFTKGEGTGNDFVVIADPDGVLDLSDAHVAVLCDRRFGIGGDGVLRVVRSAAIPDGREAAAAGAEWFMDYRNADGSAAEMCGNGIRVFAHYLVQAGLAARGDLVIGTRAGVKAVTPHPDGWEANLGPARTRDGDVLVRTRGRGPARPGLDVDLGNPHVVVALPDDDDLNGLDLAVPPHLDPTPPRGANVEFVVPHDPLVVDGVGAIRMRVYERGSGETLSCGTGVAAAAAAVRYWAGPAAPVRWRVDVPGGTLGVRFDADGHALLSGPATLVYTGSIDLV